MYSRDLIEVDQRLTNVYVVLCCDVSAKISMHDTVKFGTLPDGIISIYFYEVIDPQQSQILRLVSLKYLTLMLTQMAMVREIFNELSDIPRLQDLTNNINVLQP